jgi:CheY-like chemotaxis protein
MAPSSPTRSVLVIDDYADVRFTVAELLREESFEVAEAGSGAEGLEVLSRLARPCLILLDLELPDMDGYEFAARLRALPRAEACPLVIVTGRPHATLPPGAAGLLQKPFDVEQLLSLVDAQAPR